MSDEAEEPYKVGKGNPPREHQFPKGTIQNKGGRPKKAVRAFTERQIRRDIITLMEGEATIRIGGKRTRMSHVQVVLNRMLVMGLAGHAPSLRYLHREYKKAVAEHVAVNRQSFEFLELVEKAELEDKKLDVTKMTLEEVVRLIEAEPLVDSLRRKTHKI